MYSQIVIARKKESWGYYKSQGYYKHHRSVCFGQFSQLNWIIILWFQLWCHLTCIHLPRQSPTQWPPLTRIIYMRETAWEIVTKLQDSLVFSSTTFNLHFPFLLIMTCLIVCFIFS